jgi:hypothetical protein
LTESPTGTAKLGGTFTANTSIEHAGFDMLFKQSGTTFFKINPDEISYIKSSGGYQAQMVARTGVAAKTY